MNRKLIVSILFLCFTALPARPQGPPFVAGLNGPAKVIFTHQGNLVVAESGTPAPNTGRISLVDRATATRRTLVDGLPSGLTPEGGPSGPSGLALQGTTLYATIGAGDAVLAGPAPGTEKANPAPASPLLASLLSFRTGRSLDLTAGGFALTPADHATLKSGAPVTLQNAGGEEMTVRLVADFPDYTAEPRPDFSDNVRAGNPFGVVAKGQTLFVVDASQNLVRRVDAGTGAFTTLTAFGKVANPLPFGPPVTDPVPDSIRLRGDELLVTFLTGFPFPEGKAEVRRVDIATGANETYASGLTAAIDSWPLGSGPNDPVLALEFSANMRDSLPGRVRLAGGGAALDILLDGLPTPTSFAVDQRNGDVFITHIFPGFITRRNLAGKIPAAPPTGIIPVVASLPGAHDAQYRTSVQIGNPHPFAIAGRIVIHPQGAGASASDPALPYTLAPFATRSFDDFVAAAGASGGGSADVIAAVGSAPVIVTTIVDDHTNSMVQVPLLEPGQALTAGTHGTLVTPSDPARVRFNIGIRTLEQGAAMTLRLYDGSGAEVRSVTRGFGPNFFQQFAASDLLGGPTGASQSVVITVDAGSAIVYGSAIENASGDATLQIARAVED